MKGAPETLWFTSDSSPDGSCILDCSSICSGYRLTPQLCCGLCSCSTCPFRWLHFGCLSDGLVLTPLHMSIKLGSSSAGRPITPRSPASKDLATTQLAISGTTSQFTSSSSTPTRANIFWSSFISSFTPSSWPSWANWAFDISRTSFSRLNSFAWCWLPTRRWEKSTNSYLMIRYWPCMLCYVYISCRAIGLC